MPSHSSRATTPENHPDGQSPDRSGRSPKAGRFGTLRHDLPASIVVFLVAIPLSLGIALASGAPITAG